LLSFNTLDVGIFQLYVLFCCQTVLQNYKMSFVTDMRLNCAVDDRSFKDNQWYSFNDQHVYKVGTDDMMRYRNVKYANECMWPLYA